MTDLGSLVRGGHVSVPSPATTAEAVIAELAALLAASGHVDEAYAAACTARERTDPTGLPTGGAAVAIPHGDPSHVHEPAVAIAVPAAPIAFASMGAPDTTLEVAVVFLLALHAPEDQLAALRQVAALIQDPARLQALAAAPDADTVLAVIRESASDGGRRDDDLQADRTGEVTR